MATGIKIDVLQEDIEGAIPRNSAHCMIAEAIKATIPDAVRVAVDLQTIRFTRRDLATRYTYLTPRAAQLALLQFDAGRRPEPFSFTIRQPQTTPAGDRKMRLAKQREDRGEAKREVAPETIVAIKEGVAEAKETRKRLMPAQSNGAVPRIEGGRTPPMQKVDEIPFSRRRAFGLRALEL